ncbi:phosphoribosylformylglycinamidine cyclo-ligase, partial [Micrococcus endophyticus]
RAPAGLMATVERETWSLPPVFRLLAEAGRVPQPDLERTLNLGVGMVAVVDPEIAAKSISVLVDAGIDAWEMGTIGQVTDEAAGAGLDFVQGAKGVDGGAVLMRGAYAA